MKMISYSTKASCDAALSLIDEVIRLIYILGRYQLNASTGAVTFRAGARGLEKWDVSTDIGGGRWGFRDPRDRYAPALRALLGARKILSADRTVTIAGKALSTSLRNALTVGADAADSIPAAIVAAVGTGASVVEWTPPVESP